MTLQCRSDITGPEHGEEEYRSLDPFRHSQGNYLQQLRQTNLLISDP